MTEYVASVKNIYSTIFFISLALNLLWENQQASLYTSYSKKMKGIFFFCCTIGDAFITLFIYYLAAQLFQNPFWIKSLTFYQLIVTFLVSFILAVILEKAAVILDYGLIRTKCLLYQERA